MWISQSSGQWLLTIHVKAPLVNFGGCKRRSINRVLLTYLLTYLRSSAHLSVPPISKQFQLHVAFVPGGMLARRPVRLPSDLLNGPPTAALGRHEAHPPSRIFAENARLSAHQLLQSSIQSYHADRLPLFLQWIRNLNYFDEKACPMFFVLSMLTCFQNVTPSIRHSVENKKVNLNTYDVLPEPEDLWLFTWFTIA